MLKKIVLGLSALMVVQLTLPPSAGTMTLSYQVIGLADSDPRQARWQYSYQVSSFTFPQNWGFDIGVTLAVGYPFCGQLTPLLPPYLRKHFDPLG